MFMFPSGWVVALDFLNPTIDSDVTHERFHGCVRNCWQVHLHEDLKSGLNTVHGPFHLSEQAWMPPPPKS